MDYQVLEKKYAEYLKINQTCSVNTGTAALHLALEGLQLEPHSKVIVPNFTMYSTALSVYYSRLTPVFIDCDSNLLIDLDKIEQSIDEDTKVIMITHIYGRLVDMDKVAKLASKYNLRIIEDACEAQGAYYKNKAIGTFDIGCFSLYKNKIIAAEEGGIIASSDKALIERIRDMKNMAFGLQQNYYHSTIGFNYRMTNSQARLALESLKNVKDNIHKREQVKNTYNQLILKENQMPDNRSVVWVYDMKHRNADSVVKALQHKGIPARHGFKPMTDQPLFKKHVYSYSNAHKQSQIVFYVHISPDDTEQLIENRSKIINEVSKYYA